MRLVSPWHWCGPVLWHHVLGNQVGHVSLQLHVCERSQPVLRDHERDQLSTRVHRHRRLLDGVVSLNGGFDVTQFHPVASHLHLPVDAAEYLNLMVDKIATDVTL